MMKIDHTIKCVRKFGYHLGTILGTIWVPFDIMGTIGDFWTTILGTMIAFLCAIKIKISSNFDIYVLFWVPNGTQTGTQETPNGTPKETIAWKTEISMTCYLSEPK